MEINVATCDDRIIKIQGAARCGKTQALIDRCITLLGQGISPKKILLVASTGIACQAMRARLLKAAGEQLEEVASKVNVLTPGQICLQVLSSQDAEKFTGRHARVLNNAEYKFLQEDLKVDGASRRKIRSALSYYFCQMGKLTPRGDWILMGEEHTIIKHLEATLVARRAVLAQEVAPLAATFLKSEAGEEARHTYDYVLCDDFQNMDMAEQTCICISATTQLIVAGNPNQTVELGTVTPNPEGFAEFDSNRNNVTVVTLTNAHGNPNVAKLVNSLVRHGDMNPSITAEFTENDDAEQVLCVKWDSPEKELDALTKYLRMELNGEENLHENRTSVIVPNARWCRMLAKILKQRGFNVTTLGTGNQLGGDPREVERCKAQIAYTKLCLLADPQDTVAWRSWVGFGNFLTNSDLWYKLEQLSDAKNMTMLQGLAYVASQAIEPFPKSHVFKERYKEAQDFIKKDAKRRGFALMKAIGASKLPEFADIIENMAGDETAAQVIETCRSSFRDPVFPESPHFIRIMYPQNMTGLEADNVYVFACIDGFYPSRDAFEVVSTDSKRDQITNSERRAFYTAISKANKKLVVSFFNKSDLELAEQSKMQVMRVKSIDGSSQRTAMLRMSQYLQEAGDAYPGTTSGQQLLAEYGLD